jgi:membrane protease YdiL (CAAX protease family)
MLVIAPLLEEGIFRFPLRFFVGFSYFKWLVYVFCLLFAGIHLTNFEFSKASVWVLPIVLPQLWAGFLLSYTRLRYGIWYAVLLHSLHNLWALLFHLFD